MTENRTGQSVDPRLTRPLPRPVVVLALTLCGAAVLALLRGWHGSWTAVGTALIAPGLVGCGATAVWALERAHGRPFSRWIIVLFFLLLGGAAGGFAAVLAPSLGAVGPGILAGFFWGAIIGLGWARRRAAA